jgi:hypothetical protein
MRLKEYEFIAKVGGIVYATSQKAAIKKILNHNPTYCITYLEEKRKRECLK